MNPSANYQAFTIKSSGIADRVLTRVGVRPGFDPTNPPSVVPPVVETMALWDTGASRSVIATDLVTQLGLTPVGAQMVSHAGGQTKSPTYLVNLELPNHVGVAGIMVTEFQAPAEFKVLIGMDIISLGDFSITNVNGQTCTSFRIPSMTTVDYVSEHNRMVFGKAGRNDPCPCGKTKPNGERMKFKNCHLGQI